MQQHGFLLVKMDMALHGNHGGFFTHLFVTFIIILLNAFLLKKNKIKNRARKATEIFPELPKISVCHQYDIEYKYTYKCTMCGASSHAHSKAKKVENIRCSYCHGSIEIFLNKKDKDGNVVPTPVRKATGFAMFVKEKYHQFKVTGCTHADVMKMLSNEFAALSVDEKKKY